MTARIHRGFHRIDVVLAVPFLALGIFIACQQTWVGWDSSGQAYPVIPHSDGSMTYEEACGSAQPFYEYAIA